MERMTALAAPAALRVPASISRRLIAAGAFTAFGLVDVLIFGYLAHAGDATFAWSLPTASQQVGSIRVPAAPLAYILGGLTLAIAAFRAAVTPGRAVRRLTIGAVLLFFVISLLAWADAGNTTPLIMISLLQQTLLFSIPLIFGALSGCMCERSGVINIAIEGQLLTGACAAAIVASAFNGAWLGLLGAAVAGALVGAVLAVFAIRFLVDQIILGVVLNVLASGLTGYLFTRVMSPNPNLNTGLTFDAYKIPGLGDIPVIGPVFFDANVFLYLTYAAVIVVQVGLFSTRWGLRVRAVGEHPTAADTVGINVLATRYRNVILGGLLAGIGGAYLTVGSVGTFDKDMSSGKGYIALAAMIFGRWTPLGATGAALLFGFTEALTPILESINVPIKTELIQMLPYVATIIAVAGLVGRVRAPAADGKPYVKA
jgi:general nucleoside transport system permease protein